MKTTACSETGKKKPAYPSGWPVAVSKIRAGHNYQTVGPGICFLLFLLMLIITGMIGLVELTQQNGCDKMIASWRISVKLVQVQVTKEVAWQER